MDQLNAADNAIKEMDQFDLARSGKLEKLRCLLKAKNVNDLDTIGRTVLHWAAFGGNVDCVKLCLEMGAEASVHDVSGWTPLHFAQTYTFVVNLSIVLVDAGALVDSTESNGWTPLCYAIRSKRGAIARMLIDRGAQISNVKLDKFLPDIPDWITAFIASRSNCRRAAIIIIGNHKFHRTIITGNNDINVLRLISKHIWSTRMDNDSWRLKQ
jgi:ankyrin repeat protein